MRVSILIPYRSDYGRRDIIRDWIVARWTEFFPEYELVQADSDEGKEFSRTQAINRAYKEATGDIFCIVDSDVMPFEPQVRNAVTYAEQGDWSFPFSIYVKLTERASNEVLKQPVDYDRYGLNGYNHYGLLGILDEGVTQSGIVVVPRACLEATGGFDERFTAWAPEDQAFTIMASVLYRPPIRLEGYVIHLWHEFTQRRNEEGIWWFETEYLTRFNLWKWGKMCDDCREELRKEFQTLKDGQPGDKG